LFGEARFVHPKWIQICPRRKSAAGNWIVRSIFLAGNGGFFSLVFRRPGRIFPAIPVNSMGE
jgi:hypothetical protein